MHCALNTALAGHAWAVGSQVGSVQQGQRKGAKWQEDGNGVLNPELTYPNIGVDIVKANCAVECE